MISLRALFILTLFVLINSCSPRIYRTLLTKDQLLGELQRRSNIIQTFKGEGTIKFRSSSYSGNGSFTVSIRKPDSLLIDFEGPFGLNMVSLLISRERYLLYNRIDNTALTGDPNNVILPTLLPAQVSMDDIFQFFTGDFFQTGEVVDEISLDENSYVVRGQFEKNQVEYKIDSETLVIREGRKFDSIGKLLMEVKTMRVIRDAEISFPKVITITFPKEQSSLTITYDKILLNKPVICSLFIPNTVEMIYH